MIPDVSMSLSPIAIPQSTVSVCVCVNRHVKHCLKWFALLRDEADKTLLINGLSKYYCMMMTQETDI